MECSHCGTPNSPEAKLCRACGQPLSQSAAQVADYSRQQVMQQSSQMERRESAHARPAASRASSVRSVPSVEIQDTGAFVFALIGIGLYLFPIPFVGWFSFPCALISLIMALIAGQKAKSEGVPYTGKTITALVCSLYVVAYNLISCLAPTTGGVDAIAGFINNFL